MKKPQLRYLLYLIIPTVIVFILTNLKTEDVNNTDFKELITSPHCPSDLVLGIYEGLPIETKKGGLRIFLKSLRQANKNCAIIVVCNQDKVSNEMQALCKQYNTIIYKYRNFRIKTSHLNFFNKLRSLKKQIQNSFSTLGSFLVRSRFIVYNEILKKYPKKNGQILLTDMNDVLFQSDPFSIKYDTNLYCALEQSKFDEYVTNSSAQVNLHWIYPYYKNNFHSSKEDVYKKYKNRHIICAGTILGNFDKIEHFINWYQNYSMQYNDQGLLNIYVYESTQPKSLTPIESSRILTLDRICFDQISRNKLGLLVNNENEKYAIIHQIDRCGEKNLTYLTKIILNE